MHRCKRFCYLNSYSSSYQPLIKFFVFFGHVEKGHCFIAVEKNRAIGNTALVTKPSIHRIIYGTL